jgi:hypothetical protein
MLVFSGCISDPSSTSPNCEPKLSGTECKETSWMGSISYIGSTNTTQLPNRFNFNKNYFKVRLDFIKAPIPPSAFNGAY